MYRRFRNLANRLSTRGQQRYHIRVINQCRMRGNRARYALTVSKAADINSTADSSEGTSGTRRTKDSSEQGHTAEKSRVQFLPVLQSLRAPFTPIPFHSYPRGVLSSVPYSRCRRITPSHSAVPSAKCTSSPSPCSTTSSLLLPSFLPASSGEGAPR